MIASLSTFAITDAAAIDAHRPSPLTTMVTGGVAHVVAAVGKQVGGRSGEPIVGAVEEDGIGDDAPRRERGQPTHPRQAQGADDSHVVDLGGARVPHRAAHAEGRQGRDQGLAGASGELFGVGEPIRPRIATGHGDEPDADGAGERSPAHLVDADHDARARVPQRGFVAERAAPSVPRYQFFG